jgi:hypothetical protein
MKGRALRHQRLTTYLATATVESEEVRAEMATCAQPKRRCSSTDTWRQLVAGGVPVKPRRAPKRGGQGGSTGTSNWKTMNTTGPTSKHRCGSALRQAARENQKWPATNPPAATRTSGCQLDSYTTHRREESGEDAQGQRLGREEAAHGYRLAMESGQGSMRAGSRAREREGGTKRERAEPERVRVGGAAQRVEEGRESSTAWARWLARQAEQGGTR